MIQTAVINLLHQHSHEVVATVKQLLDGTAGFQTEVQVAGIERYFDRVVAGFALQAEGEGTLQRFGSNLQLVEVQLVHLDR